MAKLPAFPVPPSLPIAHGALTPNPGRVGALAYSTIEGDFVSWNGTNWRRAGQGTVSGYLYMLAIGLGQWYASANGGGEAGTVAGFGGGLICRITSQSVSNTPRILFDRFTSSPVGGWTVNTLGTNSQIQVTFIDGAGTPKGTGIYTVTPADLGRVLVIFWVHTGTTVRMHVMRGPVGADVAITGYTAATTPTALGTRFSAQGYTMDGVQVGSAITFRGLPADTQLTALADSVRTLGDFPNSFGALQYGVNGFSGTSYLQTASGGGIAGVVGGFHVIVRFRVDSIVAANQIFACRTNNSTAGWQIYIGNGVNLYAGGGNGTSFVYAPPGTVAAGRVYHAVMVYTGSGFQLFLDGVSTGAPTALANYTPQAAVMQIGGYGSAAPPTGLTVLEVSGGHFVPTQEEIAASVSASAAQGGRLVPIPNKTLAFYDPTQDIAAAPSSVPAQILDRVGTSHLSKVGSTLTVAQVGATITHRHSPRDALSGTTVVDGQVGPASLPDTTTSVAADALSRTGSPSVRVLDPAAIDGRVSYGVCGFTGGARYKRPSTTGGLRGVAGGWWAGFDLVITESGSANAFIAACLQNGETSGWTLRVLGATFQFQWGTGTAGATAGVTATNYVGRRLAVLIRHTGTVGELWIDGLLAASTTAAFAPSTGDTFTIGGWEQYVQFGGLPFPGVVYRVIGGNSATITQTEIDTFFNAYFRDGRLSTIAGKTSHDYDPTQDIAAAPTASPATINDRIGTDHLTRTNGGGLTIGTGSGLSGYTYDYFLRSSGMLFPGTATGWSFEVLADLVLSDFAGAGVLVCSGNTSGANGGFCLETWGSTTTPMLRVFAYNSANTAFPVDVNVTMGMRHIAVTYDGSVMRIYIDGTLAGTSQSFVYKPAAAGWFTVGAQLNTATAGVYPLWASTVRGVSASSSGIWSAAEVSTASTNGRAAGKVQGVPGKTTWRFSLVDDVIDAGSKVPPVIRERFAGISTDALMIGNAPVQVSKRVDRAWSYETSPINYGAYPTTTGQYYAGSAAYNTFLPGPHWFTLVFTLVHQLDTGNVHIIATSNQASNGLTVYSNQTNTAIYFGVSTASGFYQTQGGALTVNDIGKTFIFSGCYAGTQIFSYMRRKLDNTQSVAGNMAATTSVLALLGESVASPRPGYGIAVHGAATGRGLLTLPEYQAHHDLIVSADYDVQAIADKTVNLWSFERDATPNTLPATLVDKVGTYNLARTGAPTIYNQFARTLAA